MAETVGFEPTCGCPQTDFEDVNFGIFFYIFPFFLIKCRCFLQKQSKITQILMSLFFFP